MGKILPILLAVIGLGGGVGAGIVLRPGPDDMAMANPCGDPAAADAQKDDGQGDDQADDPDAPVQDTAAHDYVKLNNQFIVPVVKDGKVGSLVVLSLTLEVPAGQTETVYEREPRLRDAFLQVMFDHANAGGFDGAFTNSSQLNALRKALREIAQKTFGPTITDVLILDIVRQDA